MANVFGFPRVFYAVFAMDWFEDWFAVPTERNLELKQYSDGHFYLVNKCINKTVTASISINNSQTLLMILGANYSYRIWLANAR